MINQTNQQNSILQPKIYFNALPKKDYERLLPDFQQVELDLGQIIYRAEETIEYAYFPNNAMISVIANTSAGQAAEVGVIGFE